MDVIKDAFNDIDRQPLPVKEGIGGLDYLNNVMALQIGQGSKVLRSDESGLWLGGSRFADAPFSVDMEGNMRAESATFINDEGETILDGGGLISAANFLTGQAGSTDFTSTTTTSTTLVDMPNCTITPFTITRSAGIIVLFTGHLAVGSATDGRGEVYIYIGGDVSDVQEVRIRVPQTIVQPDYVTLTNHALRFISANTPPTTYTIKARWKVASGAQTLYVVNRQISYMRFGL